VHAVPIAAEETMANWVYRVPVKEKLGVTGPLPSATRAGLEDPQLNRTVPGPTGADAVPMVNAVQLVVRRAPVTPDGKVWVKSVAAPTTIATATKAPIATAIRVSRRTGLFQIGSFVQSSFASW